MSAWQPYRTPDPPSVGSSHARPDALQGALDASIAFLIVLSLLRLAVCSLHGLDFEGVLALVIVVAAIRSLTSRSPLS
jgi:hypothetical protein